MAIDADAPDADAQRDAFAARLRDDAHVAGAPAGLECAEEFKRIEPL